MHPFELLNREQVIRRHEMIAPLAHAIAAANNCLISECTAPECEAFMRIAPLTVALRNGWQVVFQDGLPAQMLTHFTLAPGQRVIGSMIAENLTHLTTDAERLTLHYADGIQETYEFNTQLACWVFNSKNTSLGKDLLPNRGAN